MNRVTVAFVFNAFFFGNLPRLRADDGLVLFPTSLMHGLRKPVGMFLHDKIFAVLFEFINRFIGQNRKLHFLWEEKQGQLDLGIADDVFRPGGGILAVVNDGFGIYPFLRELASMDKALNVVDGFGGGKFIAIHILLLTRALCVFLTPAKQ